MAMQGSSNGYRWVSVEVLKSYFHYSSRDSVTRTVSFRHPDRNWFIQPTQILVRPASVYPYYVFAGCLVYLSMFERRASHIITCWKLYLLLRLYHSNRDSTVYLNCTSIDRVASLLYYIFQQQATIIIVDARLPAPITWVVLYFRLASPLLERRPTFRDTASMVMKDD
jgi:hypothetical protein